MLSGVFWFPANCAFSVVSAFIGAPVLIFPVRRKRGGDA